MFRFGIYFSYSYKEVFLFTEDEKEENEEGEERKMRVEGVQDLKTDGEDGWGRQENTQASFSLFRKPATEARSTTEDLYLDQDRTEYHSPQASLRGNIDDK